MAETFVLKATPFVERMEMTIKADSVGLTFGEETTWHEWETKGKELATVVRVFTEHLRWWLGDWIIFGERKFHDKYTQALDETMYAPGTLRNCVWVCRNVGRDVRRPDMSFEHHYEVAKLPPGDQMEWLEQAHANHWTVKQLRQAIKGEPITDHPIAVKDKIEDKVENSVRAADDSFDRWLFENRERVNEIRERDDALRMAWKAGVAFAAKNVRGAL